MESDEEKIKGFLNEEEELFTLNVEKFIEYEKMKEDNPNTEFYEIIKNGLEKFLKGIKGENFNKLKENTTEKIKKEKKTMSVPIFKGSIICLFDKENEYELAVQKI